MEKNRKNGAQKGLKISDLSRITGVPNSTIHYYVKMGLLPLPLKTCLNMAYYDEKCIEQINLIKELQNRKFIPLEHIKHLLWHVMHENVPARLLINTHNLIFDFKKPGERFYTLAQFLKKTGLTEEEVVKAVSLRLLLPAGEEKAPYDAEDVRAGQTLRKLTEIGVRLEELSYYPRMINEIVLMDLKLHDRVTAQLAQHDPTGFFKVTEEMLESAALAREYFFKRLFQLTMLDHINHEMDENKILNKTKNIKEEQ
jgi:DNA-binding transcriptional MerR regulator